MRRRICVVTGSRADYGLLRWLIHDIEASAELSLSIIATGMHLSPEFGNTQAEIESDGHKIAARVEMLLSSDSAVGLAKSIGIGVLGFADTLSTLRPHVLVVLGDRFEIFAAVSAAAVMRVPIAHIHGGEITEGAFDEGLRHAITKLSHIHFVATEEYRKRVIQMGENPRNVHMVGAPGLDALKKVTFIEAAELERKLQFRLRARNLLVTFHPVTTDDKASASQLQELLAALSPLDNTGLIFTSPNADTEGRKMRKIIERFIDNHPNAKLYDSLGQDLYLSCMRVVDGVVGNSSSGIIEAPSLRVGTVNIGNRQAGRVRARSVIDCNTDRQDIAHAIRRLFDVRFKRQLRHVRNPYSTGDTSGKILKVLKERSLQGIIRKRFADL